MSDARDAGMAGDDLRTMFDRDADLYDRARPGYPPELFVDLADLAGLGPGSSVLEIGPGTGQATAGLVALGSHVVALELGPALATVLERKLSEDAVDVLVGAFEDWQQRPDPFDAVVAFTAWHWLDPRVRTTKAAAALRVGGSLATITTTHVAGGTDSFFARVQDCYVRWDPATEVGLILSTAESLPPELDEVDDSPLFEAAVRRRYQQEITYSTGRYLDVLATYSGHRALQAGRRRALLACIEDVLDSEFDGSITKRYLYELRIARRN